MTSTNRRRTDETWPPKDDEADEFSRFESLTKKLIAVRKKELDAEREAEEKKKA